MAKVIIVGGGPAGLAAAAELGSRCILFEQGSLPHDKDCGGFMTPATHNWLAQRGFAETDYSAVYKEVDLYFKDEKVTLNYSYPIVYALPRRKLSAWLADRAMNSGAELIPRTKVDSINYGLRIVELNKERLPYSQLILACGHGQAITERLPAYDQPVELRTLQYRLPIGAFDRLATGWSTSFGPNYTWAMSLGKDGVHVGIVGPNDYELLGQELKVWLEQLRISPPGRQPLKNAVPITPRSVSWVQRLYITGDVAGLATPMTGEGIFSAFMSGQWAARRILSVGYQGRELDLIHRRSRLQQTLWQKRSYSSRWQSATNWLIRRLSDSEGGRRILADFFGMGQLRKEEEESNRPG